MTLPTRVAAVVAATLALVPAARLGAQSRPAGGAVSALPDRASPVTTHASGEFEVKLAPLPTHETAEGALLARLSIDKQFRGDLDATSRGEMLSAGTATKGSAAYSAIERVSGTLAGRRGTFVLQHTGIMNRGAPTLTITVVPDSGTGELVGLTGSMSIDVEGGKHGYTFDYTLPAAAPAP